MKILPRPALIAAVAFCVALHLVVLHSVAAADDPPTGKLPAGHLDFFESKVRPLLVEHCYECHSHDSGESGGELLLDSAAATLKGGSHGTALTPGDPQSSLIVKAVSYEDAELKMPPDGQLDDDSIEILRRWIQIGAPDPRGGEVAEATSPLDRDPATHWAFVSPVAPTLPQPLAPHASDPIDSLADRAASQNGLRPNPIASRAVLIRRLYFDLTGLPPSYAEVQEFVSDDRPDSYARLVDRLLATPDYGERFARHWMDVSRYANTVGYAFGGQSREIDGSERFRDWTIGAFAADMPYDEMVLHQLAGDRTDPKNENGNLDAMGFLTVGRRFISGFDTLDDRIDVITRGMLGMTVACARCHDHKFDPISTADYYSIGGILSSSETPKEAASPLMLADKPNPSDHPILIRGQAGNQGPPAPRQFLTALRKPDEPRFSDGSGRWELAQRIASPDNPLTARVMVNRIWAQLIGKPLVDTPSDFGFRTKPPAVSELLDELAVDFSQHWSVKRIIRRIVLSRIYRQSVDASDEAIGRDPENHFLARANRRRRDFESLRDSTLLLASSLDRSLGGVPVDVTQAAPNPRRTVYARIERQNLPSVFRTFDFASPDTHSPARYFTTVPQQALFMMNNGQMLELARLAAQRIRSATNHDDPRTLASATFQTVLGRAPTDDELASAAAFLDQPIESFEPVVDPRLVWSYGTASVDDQNMASEFAPLTVFKDDRWQVDQKYPASPPMGHASITKSGGHTPGESNAAVVRRFTAPTTGTVEIIGQIGHASDKGDGVRISVWVAGQRCVHEHCKKSDQNIRVQSQRIDAGQTIDFVASPGETASYDTFTLAALVQLTDEHGKRNAFGTKRHFAGPIDPQTIQPLDRLAQLAQTLMMTNEFTFID